MLAVRDSGLPWSHRSLLFLMLTWADRDGFCWPSVTTIARVSGRSRRRIGLILADLSERGVVEFRDRSFGNKTHTFKLSLDRLKALSTTSTGQCSTAPLGRSSDERLRPQGAVTAPLGRSDRAPRAHKPSIEPSIEPIIITEPPTEAVGGDDDEALLKSSEQAERRKALQQVGVRGKTLDRLASRPWLTPAVVREASRRARESPSTRNAVAVIVVDLEGIPDPATIKPIQTPKLAVYVPLPEPEPMTPEERQEVRDKWAATKAAMNIKPKVHIQ